MRLRAADLIPRPLGGPARRRASGGRGGWARLGRWSRVGRAISLRRLDEVRLRVLHGAGPGRERGEVQRRGPVVVPGARRAERDLVSVTKELLASDALAVDVRTVEAPEVAKRNCPSRSSTMQCSFETILSRSWIELLGWLPRLFAGRRSIACGPSAVARISRAIESEAQPNRPTVQRPDITRDAGVRGPR